MKAYTGHECEYRRMRQKGIGAWDLRDKQQVIDPNDRLFMNDVLSQDWAPRSGKALELGCGTGPILRWLGEKGFVGVGLDVSPTAIEMAREQSCGLAIDFQVCDLCHDQWSGIAAVDLCVDGHLMHCIYDADDRHHILKMVSNVLSIDGVFVLMSMCAPVDETAFKQIFNEQLLLDEVIHFPIDSPERFEDARLIGRKHYIPTRRISHWHTLIAEIEQAGLQPLLIRFMLATSKDPVSYINVAAKRIH